jgi:hypothetical protein
MRDLHASISTFAAITIGFAAAFPSTPAAAQAWGPCAQIRAACEQAGFVQGAFRDGYGLQIDCIRPIMQETPQPRWASKPLPPIDPELVAACRGRNPNFGGPRASAPNIRAQAPTAQQPPAPDQPPAQGQPIAPTDPQASRPPASAEGQTSPMITR